MLIYICTRFSYAQRVASGLFDGHTGKIGFQNDKDYPVTVNLYHPDAPDRIFGSYRVESKQNIYLGDNVVIGGDWGIQVEGSGICIVGKVSKFDSYGNGNFFQTWTSQLGMADPNETNNTVSLNPEWLTDNVIDNSGFSLAGETSNDLCLSNNNGRIQLGCNNAPVFEELERLNDCPLCLTGNFPRSYKEFSSTTFWYQSKLGGRDSNLSNLNSNPNDNPTSDDALTGNVASKIYQGVTLMTRVMKESEIDLLRCSAQNAKSQIPQKYTYSSGGNSNLDFVVTPLASDLENLIMSSRNHIAIGGYRQSIGGGKNSSGAFTYSSPLSTIGTTKLIALSVNTVDVQNSEPNRVAAVIFHELLHNLGFGHTSNDPSSYRNRSVAILAMEDCMNQEAKKKSAAF